MLSELRDVRFAIPPDRSFNWVKDAGLDGCPSSCWLKITIAPGVTTSVVDSDLKCKFGGDSGTALNAGIFIATGMQVIADADYKKYDWVVKVDPDAVFFPDRLGRLLQGRELRTEVLRVANCAVQVAADRKRYEDKTPDRTRKPK